MIEKWVIEKYTAWRIKIFGIEAILKNEEMNNEDEPISTDKKRG